MKKITLAALMIFLFLLGGVFIGSQFSRQNVKTTDTALLNTTFNPPNINIDSSKSNLQNSQPGSLTMIDVVKHNSRNDCYLAIDNKVYDVSLYITGSYHPAGSKIIIRYCGKEVTGVFARIHSNKAWDLLGKYKIGTIVTGKQDTTQQMLTAISDGLKKANPKAEIIKVSPKTNFYIAKIIFNGKLYEVHINNSGKIFKEEVEDNETNWLLWESDNDDH